jgi:outer membrane protein
MEELLHRHGSWILLASLAIVSANSAFAAPPLDGPGPLVAPVEPPVEGPAPAPAPLPPEFDNPIVAALQPVAGGLTADQVAQRSVDSSPALAAKQAEVAAAEAQLDATIYQFIPRMEARASYTRLSRARLNFDTGQGGAIVGAQTEGILGYGPCGDLAPINCVVDSMGQPVAAVPFEFDVPQVPRNAISLQAQLGVPISDYIARLPTAKKAGKAQIRASEYAAKAEQLTVQRDARVAYYDWIRATASKVALQESLLRTQARLLDAQAGFEAGVASKADVMRLDAAVATLSAGVIRAENFQRVAEQALAVQMGEEGFPTYQIGEDLFAPEPELTGADDLEAMIAEAQSNRYEMKAFAASTESLEYGLRTTRAGYYPRLDGFAEVTYANPNQRFFPLEQVFNASWSAGVSLTFVINEAINTSAEVKKLEANQRSLEAQRELLARGVALEVAFAHAERQSVLAEIEHIERATASAVEGYRVAVDLYQVGDATTTDILDAEYEQVSATLNEINTKIGLRLANIKLLYALGRLEPSGEKL